MNYTINIPTMAQRAENKQLSIIEQATEAIKNFPEKKNATHKEISESRQELF